MKLVNLEDFKKTRTEVKELAASRDDPLFKLVAQQSEIIEALLNDISLLVGKQVDLQNQFAIVSAQSYLGLKILQDKEIILEEELNGRFQELMSQITPVEERATKQEAIALAPDSFKENLNENQQKIPGAYSPSDLDVGRILTGEDPAVVFAGKFD